MDFKKSRLFGLNSLSDLETLLGSDLSKFSRSENLWRQYQIQLVDDAIKHFNRFNYVNLLAVSEFFIRSLPDNRIHMNRINSLAFWMLIENSSDGPEHMKHRFTQILTTMSSNEDKLAVPRYTLPIRINYRPRESAHDLIDRGRCA